MKGRCTELSMLFVGLHAEITRHNKAAGFVLFADLKFAFYSVVCAVRNGSHSVDQLLDAVPLSMASAVE
eukprot:12421231-Karenia_brevis.AAC.1